MTLDQFFTSAEQYISAFNDWVGSMKPEARADHICYKCSSADEFENIRALFEQDIVTSHKGFAYVSNISKRRIAVIKMTRPLQTVLGEIWFLELSDQKPDESQTSGFDHIEIYPKTGTMEDLAKDLTTKGREFRLTERPHHTTYDAKISGNFKVRLEDCALVEKIKLEEMV